MRVYILSPPGGGHESEVAKRKGGTRISRRLKGDRADGVSLMDDKYIDRPVLVTPVTTRANIFPGGQSPDSPREGLKLSDYT